jgi:hypothetical protein
MGASEKAAAAYHPAPMSHAQMLEADILDAVRPRMLGPAALAEELVRRGWRPVMDYSAYFMGAGTPEPDHAGERGPTPGGRGV